MDESPEIIVAMARYWEAMSAGIEDGADGNSTGGG